MRAIEDQATSAAAAALGIEEHLSLLVQYEVASRHCAYMPTNTNMR